MVWTDDWKKDVETHGDCGHCSIRKGEDEILFPLPIWMEKNC